MNRDNHKHEWTDNAMLAAFICECGARVPHSVVCQVSPDRLTNAILDQLARAKSIVLNPS